MFYDRRHLIPTPELVTPAATEPLTLTELKLHLRRTGADDDAVITSLGVAARQWFEVALDRQLVTATWRIKLPFFPRWSIELPYPPLRSVGSIVYKDLNLSPQTWATSNYDVVTTTTPGRVQPKNGFAWPPTGIDPTAVAITFDAGEGAAAAVADLVKAGIKLLVGHWYENREAAAEKSVKAIEMAVDAIVAAARSYRF